MAKYRKKPVVIEAIQWDGRNLSEIEDFVGKRIRTSYYDNGEEFLVIQTLEGNMHASCGDYIIKGIKGEFYPCKPDIFEQTYESINNTQSI